MQGHIYCNFCGIIIYSNITTVYKLIIILLLIFNFRSGNLPLVKYLVEDLKCNATCIDILGWTPLHDACS